MEYIHLYVGVGINLFTNNDVRTWNIYIIIYKSKELIS